MQPASMWHGQLVIDADAHKCENPVVFCDYIEAPFRARFSLLRDRFGEQRFCILDRDPQSGKIGLPRVFMQPEGLGKGTFRPYHAETTLGGLFNRVRMRHLDREGIDHGVVYGSVALAFGSVLDPELAVALCRAYNDYIHDDCAGFADRLHPIGVLPLQDPAEARRELRRCVLELGMPAASVAPHLPVPHPDAPERFPAIRAPKALSHPDFRGLLAEAEALDVPLAIHGAPGVQLAAGNADQLDSFTLVHAFANRSLQQMALAKLIFDGAMEAFPRLRFGFLEAGAAWLPDLMHNLREHWEKRIARFDPSVEPSPAQFLMELTRERWTRGHRELARAARRMLATLFQPAAEEASPAELAAFRHEHPHLPRDPFEYLERGQIFVTVAPDDPAPAWLPQALGETGTRVCAMATDYGHWDAELERCVARVAERPGVAPDHAARLLAGNALAFYGERLRARIAPPAARAPGAA
jgi:predicted TIM-barrel fold metal-dependent hydrolase